MIVKHVDSNEPIPILQKQIAVIPALNEERTIGSVVLLALEYVDEVIVVDDGSSDETGRVARMAGAKAVAHERNQGKGDAIRTGSELAIEMGADVIVLLDGDGQHDPREIPNVCEPISNGDSVLSIGVRVREGDGVISHTRRLGRNLLDKLSNVSSSTNITDTQSGFRAFRSENADVILPDDSGFSFESSMLNNVPNNSVAEIPIANHYPSESTPSLPIATHGSSVLIALARQIRTQYPLAFFGTIGTLLVVAGGIFGYNTVSHYYTTRVFWPGKAMLSMLFTILGTQLLVGAMILDFLSDKFAG